jgi:hypothetical protein
MQFLGHGHEAAELADLEHDGFPEPVATTAIMTDAPGPRAPCYRCAQANPKETT